MLSIGQLIKGRIVPVNRIDACVNALAGIADPEAFMRDVREYFRTKGFGPEWVDKIDAETINQHLKGGAE